MRESVFQVSLWVNVQVFIYFGLGDLGENGGRGLEEENISRVNDNHVQRGINEAIGPTQGMAVILPFGFGQVR